MTSEKWTKAYEQLDKISRLEPDWDGEGGLVPARSTLNHARWFLHFDHESPPDDIYPLSDGNIIIEWQSTTDQIKRIEIDRYGGFQEMISYADRRPEFREIKNQQTMWRKIKSLFGW